MPSKGVIKGQKISPVKLQDAKALRQRMTDEETTLWKALWANRLKRLHFRRQQVIDGFIVDFYCHAAGLVVEVDGPSHARQAAYDAARDEALGKRGLRILRISNDAVKRDLVAVLAWIAEEAGRPNPNPFPEEKG